MNNFKFNKLGQFYFKKLKKNILLTNDFGEYFFITPNEFDKFLTDKLDHKKEPYLSLDGGYFTKPNKGRLFEMTEKYKKKLSIVNGGPSLHIIVVTLKCNHRCIYCQAVPQDIKKKEFDMSKETAKLAVDNVFKSPRKYVAIELQGGEPLANWPVAKYIIDYSIEKNKKHKKDMELRLVSNMSLMTKSKLKYLIDKHVTLCTSLDGPEKLHNKNRVYVEGNAHENVVKWIKNIRASEGYMKKKHYVSKIGALVTVSRFSLPYWKEIIDLYVELGFHGVPLRFANPFGMTKEKWHKVGYSAKQFLSFYKKALDYIIELNLQGKNIVESNANVFLLKILKHQDVNHLDFRSPCGAGIGQLAYNYNGDVYTCDEGRMLSVLGDNTFKLGNLKINTYQEIVTNPVVRTMCTASCLDSLAGCSDCAYKPYCGVCPLYNHFEQGNIFGQMPNNTRCQLSKGMFDIIFERLSNPKSRKIFENWVS